MKSSFQIKKKHNKSKSMYYSNSNQTSVNRSNRNDDIKNISRYINDENDNMKTELLVSKDDRNNNDSSYNDFHYKTGFDMKNIKKLEKEHKNITHYSNMGNLLNMSNMSIDKKNNSINKDNYMQYNTINVAMPLISKILYIYYNHYHYHNH